jgi:hypothetical protein
MLARAGARVRRVGWTNVDLVCAGAEEAVIPATVDAALFCAVHDVMRSPAALANTLRHTREDGRIVAGGCHAPHEREAVTALSHARLNATAAPAGVTAAVGELRVL